MNKNREFVASRGTLQEILKDVLQAAHMWPHAVLQSPILIPQYTQIKPI